MDYLFWHYSSGLKLFISHRLLSLRRLNHFFAVSSLLSSLFAPWKRMTVADGPEFNPARFFDNLSFNLISRFIGLWVRLVLIFVWLTVLILLSVFNFLIFLLYLIFPFTSFPQYVKIKKQQSNSIEYFWRQVISRPDSFHHQFLSSSFGKFLLPRLSLDPHLISIFNSLRFELAHFSVAPQTFENLVRSWLAANPAAESQFSSLNIKLVDVYLAARWWDQHLARSHHPSSGLGRPGIGTYLTFGYTPILDRHSEDLSLASPYQHQLIGRQQVVDRMRHVLESGRHILLTGQPGVGRMTVIFELIEKAALGSLGPIFINKKFVRLDYQSLLNAENQNENRDRFRRILLEAAAAGHIILIIKDFHRLMTARTTDSDFGDILLETITARRLPLIAITNAEDYQRFLSHDDRLKKFFDLVEVGQPTIDESLDILMKVASDREAATGIKLTAAALRQLVIGADKYISDIPFPEKSITLLEELITRQQSAKSLFITLEDVNQLLSEKTKVPLSRLTESEKLRLAQIETVIHHQLIGQEAAINLIGKSLRTRSLGLKNENRPIGSFLFLGPTGVGKTETAKVLSSVYFGSDTPILRFDMAEYAGVEGISRLIGAVTQNQIGALTTAIKDRPASLLLLDEIEKAPPEIFNLLLTLLDEGYLTDAFGTKINCKNLFVIATSNAGAEFVRTSVQSGIAADQFQASVLNHVQQSHIFTAEFLNRFDGVIVFEPLSTDNLKAVTRLLLNGLIANLQAKNIFVIIGDEVIDKLVAENADPTLGARPLRRAIDLTLADVFSRPLLAGDITPGDHLKLTALPAKDQYKIEKI